MLKTILVAVISAQLIIAPAQAETVEKKPVQCTKGFVGVDDFFFYFAVSYLAIQTVQIIGKYWKVTHPEKAEQQKPEQLAPDCKL